MNLYSRARRHINMNRVKELREDKVSKNKIAQEVKEQIREELRNFNSPEFSNWRFDLKEGMTSSGTFFTTLPATGNLEYTISDDTSVGVSGGFNVTFDSSDIDTFVFKVVLPAGRTATVSSGGNSRNVSSSGTYELSVSQSTSLTVKFRFSDGDGTPSVPDISGKRKNPITVFVPLDSPEASSFIRTDPMMSNLSPEERSKKLKEMLESSDEYLAKMFGDEFPGTGLDPKVGESGVTPGVEIAQLNPFQLRPDGTSGYNKPGDIITDPASGKTFKLTPSGKYGGGNEWVPVKQASDNYQDTQIAVNYPRDPKWMRDLEKMYKQDKDKPFKPGTPKPGRGLGDTWEGPLKDAKKKQSGSTMAAHYEPQGQVLSEKKLKSPEEVLNKIPGYYDGKPSPLGFPIEPPPKMVNGYHPDLVDGKKVSQRFNRLDPTSAKAMPPTGNPHIDKKVRAAAKKPK